MELVSLFEEFEGSDFFSVVGSRSKKHSKGASARRPDCTERLPCARVGNRRRLGRRACEAALDDLDGRGDGEKVRRAKKSEQKKNKIKIHFPPSSFLQGFPPRVATMAPVARPAVPPSVASKSLEELQVLFVDVSHWFLKGLKFFDAPRSIGFECPCSRFILSLALALA